MMTLMQLIKLVLDEAYDEMPYTSEADKDAAVKEQLKLLGPKYANLTTGPMIPSTTAIRWRGSHTSTSTPSRMLITSCS